MAAVPSARVRATSMWVTFGVLSGAAFVGACFLSPLTTDQFPAGALPFLLGCAGVIGVVGLVLQLAWRRSVALDAPPEPASQVGAAMLAVVGVALGIAAMGAFAAYGHLMSQAPGADTSFADVLIVLGLILLGLGLVPVALAGAVLHREVRRRPPPP